MKLSTGCILKIQGAGVSQEYTNKMKHGALRAELARYGIKRREAAAALDVSLSTLQYKLSGYRCFYLDEGFKLLDLVNSRGGDLRIEELFQDAAEEAKREKQRAAV